LLPGALQIREKALHDDTIRPFARKNGDASVGRHTT